MFAIRFPAETEADGEFFVLFQIAPELFCLWLQNVQQIRAVFLHSFQVLLRFRTDIPNAEWAAANFLNGFPRYRVEFLPEALLAFLVSCAGVNARFSRDRPRIKLGASNAIDGKYILYRINFVEGNRLQWLSRISWSVYLIQALLLLQGNIQDQHCDQIRNYSPRRFHTDTHDKKCSRKKRWKSGLPAAQVLDIPHRV